MALHLDPHAGEPSPERREARVAEIGEERRVVADGIQWLAHGALICPGCNLPVAIADSLGAGTPLRCGFCEHEARAREFVAADVYDTVANEVYVIAHVA